MTMYHSSECQEDESASLILAGRRRLTVAYSFHRYLNSKCFLRVRVRVHKLAGLLGGGIST